MKSKKITMVAFLMLLAVGSQNLKAADNNANFEDVLEANGLEYIDEVDGLKFFRLKDHIRDLEWDAFNVKAKNDGSLVVESTGDRRKLVPFKSGSQFIPSNENDPKMEYSTVHGLGLGTMKLKDRVIGMNLYNPATGKRYVNRFDNGMELLSDERGRMQFIDQVDRNSFFDALTQEQRDALPTRK